MFEEGAGIKVLECSKQRRSSEEVKISILCDDMFIRVTIFAEDKGC